MEQKKNGQKQIREENDEPISFEEWQQQRGKGNRIPLDHRMKNSRYAMVRGIYKVMHSVGAVFIAIGSFIAWLISFFLL